MTPLSSLRVIGLLVSLFIIVSTFRRFRDRRIRRLEATFRWLVGAGLATVSLFPSSVNFLRSLLALESHTHGRLLALLLVSNLLIWLLFFRERGKLFLLQRGVDKLLRHLPAEAALRQGLRECLDGVGVLVVMPAFNESDSIGQVLARVPDNLQGFAVGTVVIDDGSDDSTAEAVRDAGHAVISHPFQRGQGAALRLGYDLARLLGARIVVTLDSDGQHHPEEIDRLIEPICDDSKDFVIGSRLLGTREADSRFRLVGIHLNNLVINLLAGTRISDCSSGFKAIRVAALDRVFLAEDQFQAAEAIISAAHNGLRIGEAPITVSRRLSGQSKKGGNLRYGLNFTRTVFKAWWR